MMLPVWLRPEAVDELADAWSWYEGQRPGLGDEFRACVDAAIASIARSPEMHAPVEAEVRRCLLRRFPYGVFFIVEADCIEVLAVFHAARDPSVLRARVG